MLGSAYCCGGGWGLNGLLIVLHVYVFVMYHSTCTLCNMLSFHLILFEFDSIQVCKVEYMPERH